jgi:hypothetical protein
MGVFGMANQDDNEPVGVQSSPMERISGLFGEAKYRIGAALLLGLLTFAVQMALTPKAPDTVRVLARDFHTARTALTDLRMTFDEVYPQIYKVAPDEVRADLDNMRAKIDLADSNFRAWQDLEGFLPALVGTANAQSTTAALPADEFNRPFVLYALLGVLGLILLLFIGIYAFTKDAERMKFAQSIIQTIVSFAIGVVAGMLGTGSGAT